MKNPGRAPGFCVFVVVLPPGPAPRRRFRDGGGALQEQQRHEANGRAVVVHQLQHAAVLRLFGPGDDGGGDVEARRLRPFVAALVPYFGVGAAIVAMAEAGRRKAFVGLVSAPFVANFANRSIDDSQRWGGGMVAGGRLRLLAFRVEAGGTVFPEVDFPVAFSCHVLAGHRGPRHAAPTA